MSRSKIRVFIMSCLLMGAVSVMVFAEDTVENNQSPPAAETATPATNDMDAGLESTDAGVEGDASVEPEVEEVEPVEPPAEIDESQLQDADSEEKLPFAKGDMEAGLGLGLAGDGMETYLGVGGSFAYYIIDRLSLGLNLHYTHIFIDDSMSYEYPDSFLLLPFINFVVSRKNVAPYLLFTVGYEFEWGTDEAVNAWVLGFGGGVHIRVAKRVMVNIELRALHYWYNDKKIHRYDDKTLFKDEEGKKYTFSPPASKTPITNRESADPNAARVLENTSGEIYECMKEKNCPAVEDKKDVDREWFFPVISLGLSFYF